MTLNPQKVLIIGADGYLGHALNRRFRSIGWPVIESGLASSKRDDYMHLDIRDKKQVIEVISNASPDLVVHTAGISSLQECQNNRSLAIETNVVGTENIIEGILACNPSPRMIFLSSDYVFSGDKGGYCESSERSPKTFYGETKVLGEDAIVNHLEDHLIIRTSNVYGGGGKFFMFLMENIKRRRPIELYKNTFYTPTYIEYFTSSFLSLIRKKVRGIVHVAGKVRLSRYEFGQMACEALGVDPSIVRPCEQSADGLVAWDSSLDSELSSSICGAFCPSPAESFQFLIGNKTFPYFEFSDERGKIRGLSRGGPWREINHASSRKGTKRGGHWHKEIYESFFIIKGRISVLTKDLISGEEKLFIANAGDFFSIKPMTFHSFEMLDDVEWVNLLSNPMDEDSPDIHSKI